MVSLTYGTDGAATVEVPACSLAFGLFDKAPIAEVLRSSASVEYLHENGIAIARDGANLAGVLTVPDSDDSLAEITQQAYLRIFATCKDMGYPHLYRIWNYIPRINEPDAHGMERYRTFCEGRATAFFEVGHYPEDFLPAGTGVGIRSGPLAIVFLASRHHAPVNLENPQQVPAYHYPPCYGPKSPSFARATWMPRGEGADLYVSGTSSILGHETVYSGDVARQCQTSLENIARLIDAENLSRHGLGGGATLGDLLHTKVYIRHARDLATVREICREQLSPKAPVLFLEADICRGDLLVEIEGVVRLGASGT